MTWRLIVSGLLVGVACGLLQPNEPQSAIATVLLGLGVMLAIEARR